ncbi:uncharacterized protein LOC128190548 [Crassostrea angulata]|uniref:uncharacterized protein LOC128190548 n=1 Tax=Magallana angulata TaxID=2784310 RepID=UPI0022B17218|nr:uncharacterized protein LOC128190548 [Crassostrea angulata]
MASLRLIICFVVMTLIGDTDAHGRLMKPCQRGSLWRCYDQNQFASNFDDMGNFCGGTQVQWNRNGGKCGVCGDAYDSSFKRHEVGGPFATGFITETYSQGQQIDVMVQLTAAHLGKFIFRVCKQVDDTKEVTQECLDQNQLKVIENGVAKDYYESKETGAAKVNLKVQLPPDMVCDHCVFQWWYKTGNSWGQFPGQPGCKGCGPQETFVNCADIKITPSDGNPQPATKAPVTMQPATQAPATWQPATQAPATWQPATQAPATWRPVTQAPVTQAPRTTPRVSPGGIVTSCTAGQYLSCTAAGVFAGNRGYDTWCDQYCRANSPNCKPLFCSCTCKYSRSSGSGGSGQCLLGPALCNFLRQDNAYVDAIKLVCDCN